MFADMCIRILLAVWALLFLAACDDRSTVDTGDIAPSGTYSIDPGHAYITFYYLHQCLSFPLLRATEIDG